MLQYCNWYKEKYIYILQRVRRDILLHVSVLVCVVIPFILDVRFVGVPAGVTQEVCVCVSSSHLFWKSGLWMYQPGYHRRKVTQDFSNFLLLCVALTFLARRIQPFLSLVDREDDFRVCTHDFDRSPFAGHFILHN